MTKNKETFDGTTFSQLGGTVWRVRRFAQDSDTRWSIFNPSVAYSPVHGFWVMARSSNYFLDEKYGHAVATEGARVRSKTWLGKLSEDFQIIEDTWRQVDYSDCGMSFRRGAEDPRLFWKNDRWYFTAGLHEPGLDYPRIGLFELNDYKATLVEIYEDGWLRDVEKNWMPVYGSAPEFDYVYSATGVYKKGVGPVELRELNYKTKGVRGGSCLWPLGDSTYLALVHFAHKEIVERYNPRLFGTEYARTRRYTHAFARYSAEGRLIGLSRQFVFENFKVEFGAGLVVKDQEVIVSYGKQDVATYFGRIGIHAVLKLIEEV